MSSAGAKLSDLTRCSRCVLPETYPHIVFDKDGVCNYCLNHKPEPPTRGEDDLRNVLEKFRSADAEHDCAVAFSGGRDSMFVLHYAVRRLGLKVLAFTVDNGYMPQETTESIRRAVDILGVEHVTLQYDDVKKSLPPVFSAWVRRPSAAMVAQMCLGCRLAFWRGCMKVSRSCRVPLCLSGYGEPGISFATGFFARGSGKVSRALGIAGGMAGELVKNPRYLMRPSVPLRMVREAMALAVPRCIPPRAKRLARLVRPSWMYISLFDFIPRRESEIMDVITNELGWKKYHYSNTPWRADCKVNLLKNAMYLRTVGFSKNDDMLSDQVRQGVIGREDALERLRKDNDVPEAFLKEICAETGVEYGAFARI